MAGQKEESVLPLVLWWPLPSLRALLCPLRGYRAPRPSNTIVEEKTEMNPRSGKKIFYLLYYLQQKCKNLVIHFQLYITQQ